MGWFLTDINNSFYLEGKEITHDLSFYFSPNLILCATVFGQVFIVRGIYNFDFCFTYLCSFSGENIAVLGPATKLPLWAYDAATRSYLHPRISINIHPHVTRCAIMHFFTAYSPKWVFFCCIPTFFNFVCGRWFSRSEKENSKLPLTLNLKYSQLLA